MVVLSFLLGPFLLTFISYFASLLLETLYITFFLLNLYLSLKLNKVLFILTLGPRLW